VIFQKYGWKNNKSLCKNEESIVHILLLRGIKEKIKNENA